MINASPIAAIMSRIMPGRWCGSMDGCANEAVDIVDPSFVPDLAISIAARKWPEQTIVLFEASKNDFAVVAKRSISTDFHSSCHRSDEYSIMR